MNDTIERLAADILASAGTGGPTLVERFRAYCHSLEAESAELRESLHKAKMYNDFKTAENRELKGQNAKLRKMLFGSSSDRNPDKGETKLGEVANATPASEGDVSTVPEKQENSSLDEPKATEKSPPRNRRGRGKRVYPEHLERRETVFETSDGLCRCGCGGTIIGYDISETLKIVPAQLFVEVCKYAKYRCRAVNKVVGTSFAPRLFPHTSMSNGVLANAISKRFGCYLPWYRQESIFNSYGIDLNRSTLMKWSNRVANEALLPVYELMKNELKQNSERLFMDETTMPMLQPGNGKTKTSYMFAVHRDDRSFGGNKPPIVLYSPSKSRARDKIYKLLDGFSGIVQTDAYTGYEQMGMQGTPLENVIHPKCWAHARRYFTDLSEFEGTEDARTIIRMVSELYEMEKQVRGKAPLVRRAYRQKHSIPILSRIEAFLTESSHRHLPNSRMGKAIKYVQNHWRDLVRFVDDGHIDLDTNPVERMFKPTILLRKNALFIGSDEGGQAWGILSSIIETCKLNGVNPEPYLKWMLDQITNKLPRSEYEKLLPWNAPTEFLVGP